jgi:putative transposase
VVRISSGGSGRVSIAGLLCLRPGHQGRVFYRTRTHHGRRGERRSLDEDDYIRLLDRAHQRLRTPMIVIWDGVNTHTSARMRQLITARPWLTVIRLPTGAPDLNPAEGIWSQLKAGLANLVITSVRQLEDLVHNGMRTIQHQPDLAAGFLAQTGMTLEPELAWPP